MFGATFIYILSPQIPMRPESKLYLEIEHSKLKREKAKILLDKSFSLYALFMIIAVVGFVFKYITSVMLNALIMAGIAILLIGTFPYMMIVHKEEKRIKEFLK